MNSPLFPQSSYDSQSVDDAVRQLENNASAATRLDGVCPVSIEKTYISTNSTSKYYQCYEDFYPLHKYCSSGAIYEYHAQTYGKLMSQSAVYKFSKNLFLRFL